MKNQFSISSWTKSFFLLLFNLFLIFSLFSPYLVANHTPISSITPHATYTSYTSSLAAPVRI